jgi:hypothetical protein
MQMASRRSAGSFAGFTVGPPDSTCATPSPWHRSHVTPECANTGCSLAVFRSRKRRLRIAGVTGKTAYSRKVHGDFAIFLIGRRHVPKALLAIPVDGCFKHKAVLREKIRAAAVARADEIEELLFSLNHIVAGTIKTHPCLAVFGVNAVTHARGRVREISREQTLHGRAAGLRHGRRRVALVNLSVAFRASFIPQIVLQGGLRWLSARSRRSLLGEHGAGKGSGQTVGRGGQVAGNALRRPPWVESTCCASLILASCHDTCRTTTVAETRAATEAFSDWGYGRS